MNNSEPLLPFYEFIATNVSVGIHAIDVTGKTIIYNSKMKEIEGFHFDELADRSIIELFSFRQHESTLMRVLQTGLQEMNVKQTYWNKNGHEITTINDTFPLFKNNQLIGAIEFARDITSLEKLVYQPLRRYGEPLTFDMITAVSEAMQQVIVNAKKAAAVKLPVLLIGESGTGKDLVAEGIHHAASTDPEAFVTLFSRRSAKSVLDKVQELLQDDKAYTFFFERIDFLSLPIQEQLLELLQSLPPSKYMLIGSVGSDPITLIAENKLSKSLYYFFATMSITIPNLTDRKEDILPFVADYFSRHRERFASNVAELAPDVQALFLQYDWPGNLKELELLLDEIVSFMTTESTVTFDLLPVHFRFKVQSQDTSDHEPEFFMFHQQNDVMPLDAYLREAESYYVQNVLNLYEGNITKAAGALGMSRQNLQYRIRKMKKG
ncbi:sigma-54-dependent Fis family transcriptional regulator [Lysinibacillus sphaericus]|uniref:Arginine utilization operons transcriptional activator n=4 Tax=Lysinibacillus TaxID=400634 RepID=A0A2S0JXH4_LYSSH|nr:MULTISPECIES: sigma-54-dependent Fis family transcriptional regulator [Lysinibacillus]AHN23005.1 transcriptional regulator [Lysinibacillus varians]AVK95769.1 sigma-54-dependent Fis family transcriptional regulator [Lysinibacillus sphaericus]MCS1382786.1 sigma-54-dependent Fis family transcriptional regulator [Lysinibacillus sphaericus]MED4546093.1 sigma-54-dependent Fis family transcriptional regulator [Lysinibacillus sphaericus]TKI16259.1 sigma-54-dependent Fis family transcriptional regul